MMALQSMGHARPGPVRPSLHMRPFDVVQIWQIHTYGTITSDSVLYMLFNG